MKAVYTSDLHGEVSFYQKLLCLARSSEAEIVGVGGDLLPSFPPSRSYEDMIPNQKEFIDQFLLPFFEMMMDETAVCQIFLIPGNWDLGYPYLFKNPMERLIDLSRRIHRLENEYEMIGYPFVPPTPFRPKDFEKMDDRESLWPPQKNPSYVRSTSQADRLTSIDPYSYLRNRETIQEDLDRLPRPKDPEKTVYLMHSPPFGTKLDQIEEKTFVGSRSIREFIRNNQPPLTLHGHIHEAPRISGSYLDRIGRTLCVNPGQFGPDRRLHAVTFEVEDVEETLRHTCLP